jgi:hypothetical protein
MHVSPHDGLHLRVAVDDGPEFVGVREADLVEPAARHVHRVMVQANQRVTLARPPEIFVELREHLDGDVSACLVRDHAVEQHDAPRADIGRPVELERGARERGTHLRHQVVIARHAEHRLVVARKGAAELLVAARVVLHQIAGDEDRIGHGDVARSVGENAVERFARVDSPQRRGGVAKQMRIGKVDDSDRTHSAGLYVRWNRGPVMRVTTIFTWP